MYNDYKDDDKFSNDSRIKYYSRIDLEVKCDYDIKK